MQANDSKLVNLLQGEALFYIPPYQRSYSWTKTQVEDLLEAITDCSIKKEEYFIGTFILHQRDNEKCFDVVDGQQRLTTISLIAKVIFDKALEKNISMAPTAEGKHIPRLYDFFRINEEKARLSPLRVNHKHYMAIMENEDLSQFEQSPLIKNYYFIQKYIYQSDKNLESNLIQMASTIVNYLKIIEVKIQESENPFEIFNTINSMGLPLSFADLVKNNIVGYAGNKKEQTISRWESLFEKEEENFWKETLSLGANKKSQIEHFFDYYLILFFFNKAKGSIPTSQEKRQNKYSKTFKEHFTKKSSFEELTIIEKYAKAYKELMQEKGKTFNEKNPDIILIKIMHITKQFAFLPILIDTLAKQNDQLQKTCFKLENYLMRQYVSYKNTMGINKIIPYILENGFSYLNSLPGEIKPVSNKEIQDQILKTPFTGNVRPKKILQCLEEKLCQESASSFILANISLEHISAIKAKSPLEDSFTYNIGNMTLLDGKINSSASNQSFKDKLPIYKGQQSNKKESKSSWLMKLDTARDILEKDKLENPVWGEKEIRERAEKIYNWILKFWPKMNY